MWEKIRGFLRNHNKQKGFSTVELAVVLAIAGIIVSLVVGGSKLVENAKRNAVIGDVFRYARAVQEFQRQYGALPGDMPNITTFFPAENAVINGDGDGTVEIGAGSDYEDLYFWYHLHLAGLAPINFSITKSTGALSSLYVPATKDRKGTVPAGSLENSRYKVAQDAVLGMVFDFDRYNSTDATVSNPILIPKDTWNLDEEQDDGKPGVGSIRGIDPTASSKCSVNTSQYDLDDKAASCAVRIDFKSITPQNITGSDLRCDGAKIGARRVSLTDSCPTGYQGNVIESCTENSGGTAGVWVKSRQLCEPITCENNGKFVAYGTKRTRVCPENYKGTGFTEICSSEGTWTISAGTCTPPDTGDACTEDLLLACDIGYTGEITQKCTGGVLEAPVPRCTEIKCGASSVGDTRTVTCASYDPAYTGNVTEVCSLDTRAGKSWKPLSNTCRAITNQSCTYDAVTAANNVRTLGCPPGETGVHIQECTEGTTNRWVTKQYECSSAQCGKSSLGEYIVATETSAQCPSGIGTAIRICDAVNVAGTLTGRWALSTANCVGNKDCPKDPMEGHKAWPRTNGGETATTECLNGYHPVNGAPQRYCNFNGVWDYPGLQCIRDCPAEAATGNYTNSWPITPAGSTATNVCKSGYSTNPAGQTPQRYCNQNWNIGEWQNPTPTCGNCTPLTAFSTGGLMLWLDGADVNGNCSDVTDNTAISAWVDKSGNGRNATGAGTVRPLLKTAIKNNKSVVRFDGVNDVLVSPTNINASSLPNVTVVVVYKLLSNKLNQGLWGQDDGGWDRFGLLHFNSTTVAGVSSSGNYQSIPNLATENEWRIFTTSYRNGVAKGSQVWINGQSQVAGGFTASHGAGYSNLYFGMLGTDGTYSGNIDIAEVLVYDHALSTNDRQNVENYLSTKWGILMGPNTGLKLWLDASDSTSITKDGSNFVSQWNDKSGSGNNATQGTASYKPLYQTGVQNGQSSIYFNGVDDWIAANTMSALSTAPHTVFAVIQPVATDQAWRWYLNWHNSGGNAELYGGEFLSSGGVMYVHGAAGGALTLASGDFRGSSFIVSAVHDNTTITPYFNGLKGTAQAHTLVATNQFTLGQEWDGASPTDHYNGYIHEVLVYNYALSNAERNAVEEYLRDKWGIGSPSNVGGGGGGANNLTFWLDANDLDGDGNENSVLADAAPVGVTGTSEWKDKSVNALHVTQATGSAQPTFIKSGKNGKPTIRFDGGDSLVSATIAGSALATASEITTVSVSKYKLPLHSSGIFRWDSPTNRINLHALWGDGVLYWDFANSASGGRLAKGPLFYEGWHIVTTTKRSDNTGEVWIDGASHQAGAMTSAFNTAGTSSMYIGEALKGEIAEVLIYKKALNNTDRQTVEKYLSKKWDIPLAPSTLEGLQLWMDAADPDANGSLATFPSGYRVGYSGGGWEIDDKSGNNRDLIQNIGGSCCTKYTPRIFYPLMNGKPTFDFAFTNQEFGTREAHLYYSGAVASAQPITVFSVAGYKSVGVAGDYLYDGYNGTNRVAFSTGFGEAAAINGSVGIWSGNYVGKNSYNPVGNRIYTGLYNGTGSQFYIDSILAYAGDAGLSTLLDGVKVNARYTGLESSSTLFSEFMVYNRKLSEEEQLMVEKYLGNKWGVPVDISREGLRLWYDAADGSTITKNQEGSTNGAVSQWNDKSGNGSHLTQGTAARYPQWLSNNINNKSVIRFDGTDDILSNASVTLGSQFTLFVVGKFTDRMFVEHSDNINTNNDGFYLYGNGSSPAAVKRGGAMLAPGNDNNWIGTNAVVASTIYNGTTLKYYKNGVQGINVGAGSITNTQVAKTFNVGGRGAGALYTNGDFAEIILYNRYLTDSERKKVEIYLGEKWGIDVQQ